MFATRAFAGLQGGSGAKSLDVPVAALAGLSVAFLAFAIPADLLGDLVAATGLPSFVSAAQPPLGFKARIGVGAAGAVAVFAVTLLVLRWLERFGARPAEPAEESGFDMEPPRLRRRDVHPDAPARAPLLAVHELGEPDLELDRRAPMWDEPEPASQAPAWVEPEPEPVADEPDPAPTADFTPELRRRDPEADQANAYALSQNRWYDQAPDEEVEPVADRPWIAEPPAAEPEWAGEPAQSPEPLTHMAPEAADHIAPEPVPIAPEPELEPGWDSSEPWPAAAAPEIEPQTEFEPEPAFAPEPASVTAFEPEAVLEPEPEAEPVPPPRPQTGSISELMERLEQGLSRRRVPPPPAALPVAEPVPPAVADSADDRLQSAIENLQRFASRQD